MSNVRSSVNFAVGVSLEGAGSSERAAAMLDTHLVSGRERTNVSIQAHRHFGQERGQRLAIRLVAPELLRFLGEADQHIFDALPDVIAELLVLRMELLPDVALAARDEVAQL
jgi:hypothetical protein